MESKENQYTQESQDTVINDTMIQSLDDYYCDDYDDREELARQYLITCENCGNVWDGYAQCNCYQIKCYESDSDSSDEQEQEQDLENPTHKAAFEKSRAKKQDLENPARKFSENDETESENNEDTFENINGENINSEN